MTNLSPATQAVLIAVDDLYNFGVPEDREIIVVALRAAADQIVPVRPIAYGGSYADGASNEQIAIRSTMLAIAAELEGAQ